MKTNNLSTAICSYLKELNNLFIEMTAKNCNQHCKNCYINFPISKESKDFIPQEVVKQTLSDTREEKLEIIYLTGAEPMTHPEFNQILRLCLKYSDVCICTNGSFINEKKARFLKKVEDEGHQRIFFMLPLDHYNEVKSDDVRSRGAFRQVIHAVKSLVRYDFAPILCVTNHHREDETTLKREIQALMQNIGYEIEDNYIKINSCYNKYRPQAQEVEAVAKREFDCERGRVLTSRGVYVCPFLAGDHRGRMGAGFKDYSKKMYLETNFCQTCFENGGKMFSIN